MPNPIEKITAIAPSDRSNLAFLGVSPAASAASIPRTAFNTASYRWSLLPLASTLSAASGLA